MTYTAADMLEEGADLIERVGWVQRAGKLTAEDGSIIGYCIQGACTEVLWKHFNVDVSRDGFRFFSEAQSNEMNAIFNGAMRVLREAVSPPAHVWGPAGWNDAPERTVDQVLDKMRRVAKDLRNEAVPE